MGRSLLVYIIILAKLYVFLLLLKNLLTELFIGINYNVGSLLFLR